MGFHGHNNLEMALGNTITAINEGCEIVDATITGMGRGAGNLRTELLMIYLNKKGNINISFILNSRYMWSVIVIYWFVEIHSFTQ